MNLGIHSNVVLIHSNVVLFQHAYNISAVLKMDTIRKLPLKFPIPLPHHASDGKLIDHGKDHASPPVMPHPSQSFNGQLRSTHVQRRRGTKRNPHSQDHLNHGGGSVSQAQGWV
jgi:hypothetical protein